MQERKSGDLLVPYHPLIDDVAVVAVAIVDAHVAQVAAHAARGALPCNLFPEPGQCGAHSLRHMQK